MFVINLHSVTVCCISIVEEFFHSFASRAKKFCVFMLSEVRSVRMSLIVIRVYSPVFT